MSYKTRKPDVERECVCYSGGECVFGRECEHDGDNSQCGVYRATVKRDNGLPEWQYDLMGKGLRERLNGGLTKEVL